MKFQEQHLNLFEVPTEYALAHCISRDKKMGAGIARQFVKRYPDLKPTLLKQQSEVGGTLLYTSKDNQLIFNLITKESFYHKPTYQSLTQALLSLKRQAEQHRIQKIAMPLIGCGLDRLSWEQVRAIILDVFGELEIEILVCHYQPRKEFSS